MRKLLLTGTILITSAFAVSSALAADFWQQDKQQIEDVNRLNISFDLSSFDLAPGGKTNIILPNGQQFTATLSRIENHQLGGQSWVGEIGAGEKSGRVLLTEVSGFVFGEIIYDNEQYLIEPRQGRSGHVIYKGRDPNRIEVELENDGVIPPMQFGGQAPASKSISKPAVTGAGGTIDVGLFYHDSMIDRWGLGLAARLQFLVSLYDTALVDSLTTVRANLVHIEERAGTIDGKSNSATLTDLKDNTTNADGTFAGIEAIRTAKGIDVVTYIRRFKASAHVSCGNGFVLGVGAGTLAGGAAFSYNTVSDDKDIDAPATGSFFLCSIYTLAHEIGHNMGTQHDVANTPGDGVFSFSHGYTVDGKFRTIMGTSSSSETRLGMFSNPSITTCKDPASADTAEACGNASADAAKSIRDGGFTMQDFRATATRVVSSILPSSRAIGEASSGGLATAFATVINPAGSGAATSCGLALPGATSAQFSYQTTTPANALSGTINTPVDIADGGSQSYLFTITPGGEFTEADIPIDFFCSNRASAESTDGLNTLFFSATDGTTPDIVAVAGTDVSTPGIVETDAGGSGAFVVAISNVGAAGTVTFTGETSNASVPATVEVCQTVTATGLCMATPSATVDATIGAGSTASFAVFVTETATIPADFANTRIFGKFRQAGSIKGSTSVAVRTDTTP